MAMLRLRFSEPIVLLVAAMATLNAIGIAVAMIQFDSWTFGIVAVLAIVPIQMLGVALAGKFISAGLARTLTRLLVIVDVVAPLGVWLLNGALPQRIQYVAIIITGQFSAIAVWLTMRQWRPALLATLAAVAVAIVSAAIFPRNFWEPLVAVVSVFGAAAVLIGAWLALGSWPLWLRTALAAIAVYIDCGGPDTDRDVAYIIALIAAVVGFGLAILHLLVLSLVNRSQSQDSTLDQKPRTIQFSFRQLFLWTTIAAGLCVVVTAAP